MNYDFVWGASPLRVPSFRYGNPKIILSSYIPFNRDPNASHSLNYWQFVHPDWVLYQCDRRTPVKLNDDPNIGLDISNPKVLAWQVQEYVHEASRVGFNMLAIGNIRFDNFFGACGVWKDRHTWIQLYSGNYVDDKFRNDVIRWLYQMRSALNAIHPPLGMALDYRPDFNQPTRVNDRNEILNVTDAVVDGGGFTNFGDSFVNETVWIETIKFMIATQDRKKAYFIINQYSAIAPNVMNWILASYLMGKGRSTSVYITTVDHDTGKPQFGNVQWFQEYGAQIGSPINSIYKFSGVYRRDYSNGFVLVNHGPSASLFLSSPFYNLQGELVDGNLTVDSHSGVVLLRNYIVRDPAGVNFFTSVGSRQTLDLIFLVFLLLFI